MIQPLTTSQETEVENKSIASIGLQEPNFLKFLFTTISSDERSPLIYHLCNSFSGQGTIVNPESLTILKEHLNQLTQESTEIFSEKSMNPFTWFTPKKEIFDENKNLIASANTIEQLQHIFNETLYQSSNTCFI